MLDRYRRLSLEEFLSRTETVDAARYRLLVAIEAAVSMWNHLATRLAGRTPESGASHVPGAHSLFFKGAGWDRQMLEVIRRAAGVPAVATSPSVVEALRFFGARRISVATPYPEWNNQKLRADLETQGFEVLNVEGGPRAAASGNQGINDQDPGSVVDFAARACRPEADALQCS